ncbi:MAG TPA: 50S ribosomal protein L25/general stress protein Ctc, partial [Gammaproteobacteria bacterium]|nr:50S ribosomal protein L25/general stress protein Ctc [Gammaproteobacteria bacterium]
MSENFVLNAEVREGTGTGVSRRLRHAGMFPGVVYGAGQAPVPLALEHDKVWHMSNEEAFYSNVMTLNVGGKKEDVVVKALQRHPYKQAILHLDLQRVDAKKKLHMRVPLHLLNEDTAVGVKLGGTVSHLCSEVEVVCLPADLPEYLELDIAALEIDSSLHLSDIKLPKGVELAELVRGADHDQSVVAIHKTRGAEIDKSEDAPSDAAGNEEEK